MLTGYAGYIVWPCSLGMLAGKVCWEFWKFILNMLVGYAGKLCWLCCLAVLDIYAGYAVYPAWLSCREGFAG
jgi:hypothetical protein